MKEVALRNVIALCMLLTFLTSASKEITTEAGCHAYLHASYTRFLMKLLFFSTFLSPQRHNFSQSQFPLLHDREWIDTVISLEII